MWSKVMRIWSEFALRIPLWLQKTLIIISSVTFIVHILACLFWLIKKTVSSAEEVEGFLAQYDVPPDSSTGKGLVYIYLCIHICANTHTHRWC